MELVELKKECESKRILAEKIYKDRSADVFLKELRKFSDSHSDEMSQSGGTYFFRQKIEMSVIDGNLEIIDRRGTAFLWVFELVADYSYSDGFEKMGRPYSVRFIKDESFVNDIKKVMANLDYTIQELGKNEIVSYKYLCDHEDVEVSTFDEVIQTVLNRNPVIC